MEVFYRNLSKVKKKEENKIIKVKSKHSPITPISYNGKPFMAHLQ